MLLPGALSHAQASEKTRGLFCLTKTLKKSKIKIPRASGAQGSVVRLKDLPLSTSLGWATLPVFVLYRRAGNQTVGHWPPHATAAHHSFRSDYRPLFIS